MQKLFTEQFLLCKFLQIKDFLQKIIVDEYRIKNIW